jgi:hypothetical protein
MHKHSLSPLLTTGGAGGVLAVTGLSRVGIAVPPAFQDDARHGGRGARRRHRPRDVVATVAEAIDPGGPAPTGALSDTTLDRLLVSCCGQPRRARRPGALRSARAARTEASSTVPTIPWRAASRVKALERLPLRSISRPGIWDAGFDASWELDLSGRVERRPGQGARHRRRQRGPSRRAGGTHGGARPHLLRAARRPGAARRRPEERREPAPHARGDAAAA